jgi:hypothetical protein
MIDFLHGLYPSLAVFAALAFIVFLAGTIRSFTGFGSGLVMAPTFSYFMPPSSVVAVMVLLNFVTTIQMLPGIWKHIDWKLVLSISIPGVSGVPIGIALIQWLDPLLIRKMISILVATLAILMLIGWQYQGIRDKKRDWAVGLFAGTLNGVAGVGGPPLVLYLINAKDISPQVFRSFFMTYFAFIQVMTLTLMFFNSTLNISQFAYAGSFLPVYILSTVVGSYLFNKALKNHAYLVKRVALWFLLFVGVVTLIV